MGFSIDKVSIGDICWIHRYDYGWNRGISLHLYMSDGKKKRIVLASGNLQGTYSLIQKMKVMNPELLVSEGFISKECKACRKKYKEKKQT